MKWNHFTLQEIRHMIFQQLCISALLLMSCDTGKLTVVADIPSHLREVSAAEIVVGSDLIWIIEDAGNDNHVYGLDTNGNVKRDITVTNAENKDWEDLTSDASGNLYIGDFGNNSRKRKQFTIYKIANPENSEKSVTAEIINFELPKGKNSEDFEAFFIYENSFYIFSKESKNCIMLKVPNEPGTHVAKLAAEFKLEGKNNLITSADISNDGSTVVLLNHDKVWKLTGFTSDNFLEGKIDPITFEHDSQKEGVCFANNSTLLITDESDGSLGSNIYTLKL